MEQYYGSAHGKAAIDNEPRAPDCNFCHGPPHNIRDVESSENLSVENLPDFCGTCHAGEKPTREAPHTLPYRMLFLKKSVHENVIDNGGRFDAHCPDCHVPHNVQPATEPASTVHFKNVSKTCGTCHPDEYRLYSISIHGTATAAGIEDAPTCPDCHYTFATKEKAGLSEKKRVALCIDCHSDQAKMAKYGVNVKRVDEYRHTFHGKAIHYDFDEAADCIDCHTAHAVLPADDERSSIAEPNILATCSAEGCHTGAIGSFGAAGGHLMDRGEGADPLQKWTAFFFIWLTRLIITLLILHIVVGLQRELPVRIRTARKRRERLLIPERVGDSAPLICVLSQIKKRGELTPERVKDSEESG
jgi:predicted CXXCH cytochrome family protein